MAKIAPDVSYVAALMGDPARANMLCALMSGMALTAKELAAEAGVLPQTASSHLAKLEEGGLVTVRQQGRHRYFTLASAQVASVIETLSGLGAGVRPSRVRPGPRDAAMRHARVCYDHLAGAMAVHLFDSLVEQGGLDFGTGLALTPHGEAMVAAVGVDVAGLRTQRARLVRECLDWSERRSHLGGSLGRALCARFEELGWIRRQAQSRTVRFTPHGVRAFTEAFPLNDPIGPLELADAVVR